MTTYICSYCKKVYKQKSAYNNHYLKCELLAICNNVKTKDEADQELDIKFNGSINDVYKLLINLNNKFEKLETDYNELKKYANITKNKIDVIEYLNTNFDYGDFDFTKFLNSIEITDTELDIIFEHDYINGIYQIIIDNIEKNKNNIPIKAFNNKEGILYICLNTDGADGAGYNWVTIDDTHINSIQKYFNKRLSPLFLQWQEVNKLKISPDHFTSIYVKNMKRVFAINFERKNINVMLKNKLYKHLKISLRNYVSHDFI
jgi:hypothetical protein